MRLLQSLVFVLKSSECCSLLLQLQLLLLLLIRQKRIRRGHS